MANDGLNFISFAGSVAYFVGTFILFSCGDASHVSWKTLQLMFFQLLIQIPMPGDTLLADIIRYALNLFVVIFIIYQFKKTGCKFNSTYDRQLDDFPFHWLLVVPALVIPILIVFLSKGAFVLGICAQESWQVEGWWWCTNTFLWATSHFMLPLMFLPQIRVCYKLSKDQTPLNSNVKMFLVCMIIYCSSIMILWLVFGNPMWPITLGCGAVAVFLLLLPILGFHRLPVFCCLFCERERGGSGGGSSSGGGSDSAVNSGKGGDIEIANTGHEMPSITASQTTTTTAAAAWTSDHATTTNNVAEDKDGETPTWLT